MRRRWSAALEPKPSVPCRSSRHGEGALATKRKWWPDSIIGRVAVIVVLFIAGVVVLFGVAYFALFLVDLIF